jgi:hypothetical protein
LAWFAVGALRINVQGGTDMGEGNGHARRIASRLIAAVAVTDMAYRLFIRAPLRRALGIEVRSTPSRGGA